MEDMDSNILPEDCVSTILSFTSPLAACRSSLVSSVFKSAMESDIVWERFLPSDYRDIVSRLVTPLKFSSKKELFLRLCDPVFIDGGKKIFMLEKSSGRKSFILSARELSITWSTEPLYWSWISTTESRFLEVAVLRTISWLEIQGKIRTQMLSPNTTYGAYLIMNISARAYGLDSIPSEISIEVGNQISTSTAYIRRSQDSKKQQMERQYNMDHIEVLKSRLIKENERVSSERKDGWLEIELGEFFSCEDDEEVKMSLMEVKGYQLKGGLVIEGIEVRPKH